MKSERLSELCVLSVLLLCCLSACTISAGKRWNERSKLCDQPRIEIPPWPLADYEAYSIQLLGVVTDDRTKTQIERDCRADL